MSNDKPPRRSLLLQLSLWLLVAAVGAFLLVVIQRAWLDIPYGVAEGTRPAGLPGLAAPGSVIWWLIDLIAVIGTALLVLTAIALAAPPADGAENPLTEVLLDYAVPPPHSPFKESGRLQSRYLVTTPGAVSPLLARLPDEKALFDRLPSGRYAAQLYRVLFVAQPARSFIRSIGHVFGQVPSDEPLVVGGGKGSIEIVESADPPGRWCRLGRFPFHVALPRPVRAIPSRPWYAHATAMDRAEDLARRRAALSGRAVMVREPIASVSLY